jgi:hypothetical protein
LGSVKKIVNSAYAFVLTKFIAELEPPHRFLILGFGDILEDLSIHFENICKGNLIVPTGKLEEISRLRRTLLPCLIALGWEDVGKYASWTTSFKILDESPLKTRASERRDVYDPVDVTIWLSEKDEILDQILKFVSEKLGIALKPIPLETLRSVLTEIRRSMQQSRSYAEWFHPRKIIEALTLTLQFQNSVSASYGVATIGQFLRKIGMEPSSELDNIPIFGDHTVKEGSLKEYFRKYGQISRNYLASPYEKGSGRLRKTFSALGLNLLRRLMVVVAEDELSKGEKGKWCTHFLEFEQGRKERRTRKRKYDVNIYGATIISRSPASGLPTRIQFVLERGKDFSEDNILPKLFKNELKALFAEYKKTSQDASFEFSAIKMIDPNILILELLMEKRGLLVVDPYIEGSKAPIRKINDLLSKLGVE